MRHREGQSSIEIVVAIGILGVALAAAVTTVFSGQSLGLNGLEMSSALRLAREGMENARASAQNDFAGLASSTSAQGEFTREIVVEALDPDRKLVTSRVKWQTNPLRSEQVELVSLVTNARYVESTGGDTGGGGTEGDWQHPETLDAIDLGPGNAATGLDVFQKIIYLTAEASDSKKPDFYVVDATDGQNLSILGQLDTGGGLFAVDFAPDPDIAYVGNGSSTAQLQVINVSNPSAPALQASLQLPGVSGNGAVGRSVFFASDKVYVGTDQATGPEFHVVDVSDPSHPASLGSFEVGADVNSIRVMGHLAYLATSDNSKELRILDIQDPDSIVEAGSYNASSTADGLSLHLAGSSLYLGRAGSGSSREIAILDVTDPAALSLLGSQEIGADVNGIHVRDDLMFLATSDSNKEFQVWNIANPAAPDFWSSFNFPQVATAIDFEDNLVYVSVRSNDAVRIITSGP